jgi:hypothetical protein
LPVLHPPLEMKAVWFPCDAGVVFGIKDEQIGSISPGIISCFADKPNFLTFSMPAPHQALMKKVPCFFPSSGRVASFLLEMAGPASEGNTINLPMTRQDIGEYLGLTIETVSRTLAHLEATAAIEVHSRQIVLRDRSALRRLNA